MAVTVTIEGVTKSVREMSHSAAQNERDRLSAVLVSPDGTNIRPDIDDEVLVVEDGATVFGGSIKTPELAGFGTSPTALTIKLSALDYNELGDRIMLFSVSIPAGTLKAAATALLPYLPGVTIDSTWTASGDSLPALTYDGVTADAALADLSTRTGWVRTINYQKKLKFWSPGTVSAPWNVADGDGNVVGDLSSSITRKDYANRVIVKYMAAAGSAYAFFGPTAGANPSDGETTTVGSKTYTFRTAINNGTANEVLIGGTAQATFNNLAAAITEGAGKGTSYSTPTTASTQVSAWEQNASFMKVQALTPGAAGNSIAVSDTCAGWHWFNEGGIEYATLMNGSDAAASNWVQRDNLPQQALYGVYTRVVEAPNVWTVTEANTLGDAILEEAIVVVETVRYRTTRAGLTPGMTQTISSAVRHVTSNAYLIVAVETRWMAGQPTWRDVTAIRGSIFKNTNWRDQYKKWSGASGTTQSVSYAGGGGTTTTRFSYTLGGSRALLVSPNPKAYVPIAEWVPMKAPVGFSALARVWLWARNAGVTVTCKLMSGTDGVTFGTTVATFSDVTSQSATERSVTFNAEADKYYRLEVYPSADGEGVGCVGYVESF